MPIEPKWSFQQAFEAAEEAAKPFVAVRERVLTLHLKKEYRKGRVFLDIFRNRNHQTIVAPYSVRGLASASVSAPLTWDDLSNVNTIQELNIKSVVERVLQNGDPWEAIAAYAEPLHTQKKSLTKKSLTPSRKHKEPETLKRYEASRDGLRRLRSDERVLIETEVFTHPQLRKKENAQPTRNRCPAASLGTHRTA